ncbi:uncharacterized protein [Euphorbia lathyris]|uniref:uncharacterized protein isoform X2 n=1 Tax=Euphorbia lathyris TaxID=212925 RepID=UPI0033138888
MADGNLHLPDDLLSSNTNDEVWGGGTVVDEAIMGSLDDSKDQVTSDSGIPLSPQWLYAKPVDAKIPYVGASVEMCPLSSHGKSLDNSLKEGWWLDGSQDIKDRRMKTAPDIENSHRWREEERDTSLLGRRDRRKEERRADSMLSRDITDSKSTSSSDRWHDSGTRNCVHESRRDSKWSSRWGPEDKEKDSRTEKRADVEKEDPQIDKLPSATGSRTTSDHENESRDKWRPRHRMEVHAGGTTAYRGAPGFGTERGRVEGSNVRFSAGRGRSIKGNIQMGRQPSAPAIGSIFLDKNLSYSYPRGKLLDIYRWQITLPSFDTMPDAVENVINITQNVGIEPLAFVAPDAEEEAALGDLWLGKITSCGGLQNQLGSSDGASNDDIGGLDEATSERNWRSSVETDEIVESFGKVAITDSFCGSRAEMSYVSTAEKVDAPKDSEHQLKTTNPPLSDCLVPAILKKEDSRIFQEIGLSNNIVEQKGFENQRVPDLVQIEHPKLEDIEKAHAFQIGSQLFDDPGFPFEFTSRHQCKSRNEFAIKSIDKAHPLGSAIPADELSFCYLDPQGVIQGPYLGIDILTWFEQGYFGTDLPVRFSDALDGSPFHELGEIMLYLKAGSVSTGSKLSDTVGGCLELSTPDFAINHDSASGVMEDHQLAASRFEAVSGIDGQLRASNDTFQPGIMYSDDQKLQNFVSLDEGFPPGRPGSNCGDLFIGHSAEIQNLVSDPSSHPSFDIECSGKSIHTHQDENLHPFGLLMSELTGNSQSRCTHPSNISSSIGGHGQFMDPFLESNIAFPNQSSISALVDQMPFVESCSDDYCKKALTNANIDHQSSKRELDFCDFNLQHQILQNLQKGQLQQHNNSPHTLSNNRFGIEENPSHLFNLQLQQQQQIELQQQQQIELQQQQQQQRLELQQQQWQLELQQQQRLELQQQKRQLELQQQQRQLELQQQQRQLELIQQQRQLDLQQQQRQLEFQKQHQLLQQQLRNHQVKLQEQLVVEQLLRHQMSDFGCRQQKVGTVMDNIFEQVQLSMQLPELLQNSHPSRHLDPAVEQIIRAKIGGLNAPQDPKKDYLDLLQANHGNVLHSNQFHVQQEPLQAQLSWALKQQLGMDGERHLSGSWSADESSQLPRNLDLLHQPQSLGFNAPNFYQQQPRLSSMEEHVNHLRWKHALKERLEQGFYEPSSLEYERSISLPHVAAGIMDSVNGHPLHPDSPEQHLNFLPAGRLGSFSGKQISDNFYGSRPETMDYLSRKDRQLEISSIEDGVQQLHPESHRWSKVSEVAANSDIWTSIGTEEESSKRLMMELHRKLGHHQSIQAEREYQYHISSSEPHDAFWGINQLHSSNLPLNHIPDQEVATNLSIMQGQHDLNLTSLFQGQLVSAAVSGQNGSKSNYGAIEEQSSLSSTRDSHTSYVNARSMTTSKFDRDLEKLERKGNFSGSKAMSSTGRSVSPIEDKSADQAEAAIDFGKLPIKVNGRRGSISNGGNQGFYSHEKGHNISFREKVLSDSTPSILTKGIDNTCYKRPPSTPALASHDGLSELAVVDQKSLMSRPPNVSEKRHESEGNVEANSMRKTKASAKKEMRFRRSSSYGDATVSETSFIDVLKKPVYSEADAAAISESFDGGSQAGRSGKKKGKKGRQIDPALLGFKVSSNRIMMGEIYRLQD